MKDFQQRSIVMLDRLLERGKRGNKRRGDRGFRQACKSFFPSKSTLVSTVKIAQGQIGHMGGIEQKENDRNGVNQGGNSGTREELDNVSNVANCRD